MSHWLFHDIQLVKQKILQLTLLTKLNWWMAVLRLQSPLSTAATAGLLYQLQMIDDGDCGAAGGMKIGRGNRSTRRKPVPRAILSTTNPTWPDPGRRGGTPATNRLTYDTAHWLSSCRHFRTHPAACNWLVIWFVNLEIYCKIRGFHGGDYEECPEDGGDTFLRNAGSHQIYTRRIPEDGILRRNVAKLITRQRVKEYIIFCFIKPLCLRHFK
jgi:hypothetical protein